MRVMARQSQHMARMVDDLLDVSRFNRGHIELRRALVDLRRWCSTAWRRAVSRSRTRGCTWS
ncbi:hypothetical protein ACN28S_61435 [Cystobacter fuscus]